MDDDKNDSPWPAMRLPQGAQWFAGGGALVAAAGLALALSGQSTLPSPAAVALLLIGALVVAAAWLGHQRLAAPLLCASTLPAAWTVAEAAASPVDLAWSALPAAAMAVGWLLGQRSALAHAATGYLSVAAIYGLHLTGLSFAADSPAPHKLAGWTAAAVLPALLGAAALRALRSHRAALRESQRAIQRAQALARIGSWTLDFATRRTTWSDENYRLFGLPVGSEVTYRTLFEHVHPDDVERAQSIWSAARAGQARHECTYRIVVGADLKWISAVIEYDYDPQGKPCSLFAAQQDVTAMQQARQQIDFLSSHDTLTGLPNRQHGQQLLGQAIAVARRQRSSLALLCLDFDRFKHVNDAHGQEVGDRLLQAAAQRLRGLLRADDAICRSAADEFIVILPQLGEPSHIASLCDRVLAGLSSPFELAQRRIVTSASIGLALYPHDAPQPPDACALMRNAETALSEAKRQGAHRYCLFDQRMNARLLDYLRQRDALRLALERDEFVLHYQPMVALDSGRLLGVEAQLRWQSPGRGLLTPDAFSDAAEQSRMVLEIGRWMLREACRQAAAWHAAGCGGLVVAVKLAALQLSSGQVEQDVAQALAHSGLDPRCLELELSETLVLQQDERLLATLARWRQRGIRLSVDDFGSGRSTLAHPRRLPVDGIRLSPSLVQQIDSRNEDLAIVRATLEVAQAFKLRTIATGIEREPVADLLRRLGCDQGQGPLYSQPLPAAQIGACLASAAARSTAVTR